jgi:microsomal dipeptidase-like Zn-dependent dipeptidase
MFADLGFGAQLFSHGVDPKESCRELISYSQSFSVVDIVRTMLLEEATRQAEDGKCFPTPTNLVGQQMDFDSLRRAWAYGLRLLVVLAVNSEFMCRAASLPTPHAASPIGSSRAVGGCFDASYIEAQLRAAKRLEAKIDADAGGPGLGWYRIVYMPAEARNAIEQGKLAVVLGVESANAFGCSVSPSGLTPGIGPLHYEITWAMDCEEPLTGLQTQQALAWLEHWWDLGARHFFPIHNMSGVAGGTALSVPFLHADENPTRLSGGLFDSALDTLVRAIRPKETSFNCSSGGFEFDGGRCNSQGLTSTGAALVKMLSDYGAIIDVDHMSYKAKLGLWNALGEYTPVVSGHTGENTINNADKSNEAQLLPAQIERILKWGGAIGPTLMPANVVSQSETFPPDATIARHECGGTTETFIQTYRYLVDNLQQVQQPDGSDVFLGLGYGSDFNGFMGWPEPRLVRAKDLRFSGGALSFGEALKAAFIGSFKNRAMGRCYSDQDETRPRVHYPFTSPLTHERFNELVLPWSAREEPYDISFDGVANVGMIPDFIEEMRVLLGTTGDELEPAALWHGAEAYIRTWERAQAWSGRFNQESDDGTFETCRALRSRLLKQEDTRQETLDTWRGVLAQLADTGCFEST